MYVLLMLVLATLVVWFVVYNILSYWLKKKGILQDELGNQRHDVITVVDRVEEQKLKVKNLEAIEDASGLKVENLEAEKEEAEMEAENLKPEEERAEIEAENLKPEEDRAEIEAKNLEAIEDASGLKVENLEAEKEEAEIETENLKSEEEEAEIETENLEPKEERAEIEAENLEPKEERAEIEAENLEPEEERAWIEAENLEAEKEEAEIEAENLEPEEERAEIEAENLEPEEERAGIEAEIPKSEEEVAKEKINSLISLLESRNVKYKDDRNNGGGFWIFGEGDLSHVILDANKLGLKFYNNNNRWYLDNKKVLVKKGVNKRTEARDSIMILLNGSGIKYVDRRNNKNGKLWIIGGNELKNFVEYAKQFKIYFKFQPEGDADTKHKPGWWIK